MLAVRGARLLSAAAGRAAAPAASTVGKPIECLAAVAWAPRKEYWQDALSVEKVVVQPPKKGEVRVKITHAGTWVGGTRWLLTRAAGSASIGSASPRAPPRARALSHWLACEMRRELSLPQS